MVFLGRENKKSLLIVLVLSILLLVAIAATEAALSDLSVRDQQIIQTVTSRSNDLVLKSTVGELEGACEVHVLFKYAEPQEGQPGGVSFTDQAAIQQFLQRLVDLGYDGNVNVYSFASFEGATDYNVQLSDRRMNAVLDYIISAEPPGAKYNINAQSGGETKDFFPITTDEERAINRLRATLNVKERAVELNKIPALTLNRRVVLVADGLSAVDYLRDAAPGTFYDGGCPKMPKCGENGFEPDLGEQCDFMATPTGCPQGQQCNGKCACEELKGCVHDKFKSSSEQCDPTAIPNGCPADQNCSNECKCFAGAPVPVPTKCTPNGIKEAGEECDPKAATTGCSGVADYCYDDCRCGGKGVGATGWSKTTWIILIIIIVLAALMVPMFYKRKRLKTIAAVRARAEMDRLTTWEEIIVFFETVTETKKVILIHIEELLVLIAKLTPKLKEDLKHKIQDPAYLLDKTSADTKNLDDEGKLVKEILEKYLALNEHMVKLYGQEMNIEKLLIYIEQDKFILSDNIKHQEIKTFIQQTKKEITRIREEVEIIIAKIESQTREGGILLSGVVSLIGGTIREWRTDSGIMQRLRHFHDQKYLRSDKYFGAGGGVKRVLSGTRAFEPDYGYKAPETGIRPVDKALEVGLEKDIWPWREDRVRSITVIYDLFERFVVDIERNTAMYAQLRTSITKEIEWIKTIIIIIKTSEKPVFVKIEIPENTKVSFSNLPKLLDKTLDFTAKITEGIPPYTHIWHWGPHNGDPKTKMLPDQVGTNLLLIGSPAQPMPTYKNGTAQKIITAKGFKLLKEKAPNQDPFAKNFSVDGKGEKYELHITVQDGSGKIANDKITIEVASISAIIGKVVDNEHPDQPIEGATVWAQHSVSPESTVSTDCVNEKGKRLEVKSGKDGEFRLEGHFKHNITVYAQKADRKGSHMLKPHGRPDTKFSCPPSRTDVIVPLWIKPKEEPLPPYPEPIDPELIKNIGLLDDIKNGHKGGEKLAPEVRGIKNHVPLVLEKMKKEIQTHLDEINTSRKGEFWAGNNRKKMAVLLRKKSVPLGLDDYSEGRFFGFLHQQNYVNSGPLEAVHIEKFVFGSPRRLAIGYTGVGAAGKAGVGNENFDTMIEQETKLEQKEGNKPEEFSFSYRTRGIGVEPFVNMLFAGNVSAVEEVIKVIEEKKKLITGYIQKVEAYETELLNLADKAHREGDEDRHNAFFKMATCFGNIRDYCQKHGVVKNLEQSSTELKEIIYIPFKNEPVSVEDATMMATISRDKVISFYEKRQHRPKSRNKAVDDFICAPFQWTETSNERWDDATASYLEQKFQKVLDEIDLHYEIVLDELRRLIQVLDEQYHNFQKDVQEYREHERTKHIEMKKAAGADWI